MGGRGEPPASPERLRLFVALELPSPVREELARWRATAPGALRMIAPEYLHATLCFLGWRAASEVPRMLAACGAVRARGGLELELGEPLWLPRRRPRVLAVSLRDRSGRLAGAQAALSDALAEGGWYRAEKRPYLAHVTVARVPSGAGGRPRQPSAPAPVRFEASRVTLYRSRLSAGGARYETLGTVELS